MSRESVSPKIRKAVKDVVGVYVHHMKDKIAENDMEYIKTGVDANIDTYEEVFNNIMGVWLKGTKVRVPKRVLDETISAMERCVDAKDHSYFIAKFPDVIFRTSKAVLKETKDGVVRDERN